jgi:NaMN:DMB phosphoribosyltransferase
MKDTADATRALGFVIALKELSEKPSENRSFVDYEEIDRLIKGIESVGKVNETMSKLASFEARYRSLGDLEINVFRQTRSGTAASLSSGICDRVTALLTIDDLDKLRGYLIEAKARLDEIK